MEILVNTTLFVFILAVSLFYSYSKRHGSNLFLLFFSFLQGFILCFIYSELIKNNLIITLFTIPLFAAFYYLLIKRIPILIIAMLPKETYIDDDLVKHLNKIDSIKDKNIILKKYSKKEFFNAFVLPSSNKIKITFGQKLVDKLNTKEKIFIIAHEVSHNLKKHRRKILGFSMVFIVFFTLLSNIISQLIFIHIEIFTELKTIIFTFISLLIFITIIICFNLVSWHYEYDADKKAIILTKDFDSLKNTFEKVSNEKPTKDYGKVVNLILYDHPLINDRIKKAKIVYNDL